MSTAVHYPAPPAPREYHLLIVTWIERDDDPFRTNTVSYPSKAAADEAMQAINSAQIQNGICISARALY